jgi:hypothetical protein
MTTVVPGLGEQLMTKKQEGRGDSGAVLLLALAYILVVSGIVAAMASWSSNALHNTHNFSSSSALDYSASSAINTAIQSNRYTPNPSSTPADLTPTTAAECWIPQSGTVSRISLNNMTMAVWCSTDESLSNSIPGYPNATRVVTLSECLGTVTTGAACQSAPILQAVVSFDDYSPGESVQLKVQCVSPTCGPEMTLDSWVWG